MLITHAVWWCPTVFRVLFVLKSLKTWHHIIRILLNIGFPSKHKCSKMDYQTPVKESDSKKRFTGTASTDLKDVVRIIAKLSLSNSQSSRLLKSILIDCWKLEASSDMITNMKEATRSFADTAKSMREDAKTSDSIRAELATPAVHAFNAILKTIFPTVQDKSKKSETEKFVQYYQSKGLQELARWVKHCKAIPMYDKKFIRLELHISEEEVLPDHPKGGLTPLHVFNDIVKPFLLTQKGYAPLQGMAPAGDLERQVQAWIDKQ